MSEYNRAASRTYGCENKNDYRSWRDAERVAKRSRRKGRAAGVVMTPYRCKLCGGYHLASLDNLERDRRKHDKRHKGSRG